jgi:uncharacterized membrane protein
MRTDAADELLSPPFLERLPPVWIVRGLATLLIVVCAAVTAAALLVRIPETVTASFVIVAGDRLRAQMTLAQEQTARIRAGQPVQLFYSAFPYQRYGAQDGQVAAMSPIGDSSLAILTDLARESIAVDGEARPLRSGMTGQARVVVGRRTLFSFAFEPVRAVRENLRR